MSAPSTPAAESPTTDREPLYAFLTTEPFQQTRPYTATGAASARTSFTRVGPDVDAMLASDGISPHSVASSLYPSLYDREQEERALQEEQAEKEPEEQEPVPQIPQTCITFLCITGRRRTMSFEPETTVGRVKELLWNAWPSEWQSDQPPAPSYLRLLHLGKIIQDDDTLAKLNFPVAIPSPPNPTPATIVHLSIRPIPPPADDGGLKKRRRTWRRSTVDSTESTGEDGESREAGCCNACIIC
ncbi:hypothetical protein PLICRDRAFT_57560 [Plicaturopsis crispa FD-325 SS-3]|uniref:Ubiquitin-like domain-containing protein n=1 Tax=Plicaturopsis crispa FD-325 SS-3 TaxID=944288 RepID=A0A0C9SKZ3_PLICR|nr:hypothetical protein PLICRDRAFT_57560 [Plicaturopsis crispa FD-325 SS-3]